MNNNPVIIEKLINAPVKKVWQAITDKGQMKQWYFDVSDFKPEVGFEFRFAGQGSKGEQYIHICKIIEVVPLKKLQYSWQYLDRAGYSVVTFELFEETGKTRVKLTHTGLETFPQDNTDFARDSFNAGWTELITASLPKFVESK
ncbi:MAG: SRPBCC domain-containing protein [Chitinophagaceae bacterium]|nr:MAG: SRPBCC domain-containing protein [Chitinophagaceae bacterium]